MHNRRWQSALLFLGLSLVVPSALLAAPPAAVEKAAAPVDKVAAPVDKVAAPVDKVAAPVGLKTAPVAQAAAPAGTTPAAKTATTLENLQAAFHGESNAQVKYLDFAKQANLEGYPKAAALFQALSDSEGIHAAKHAEVIKGMGHDPKARLESFRIGTTRENLETALKGESHEIETMYPEFIKQADADKNSKATMSFGGAKTIEAVHAKLLTEAIANLEGYKTPGDFYVCQVCGNVVAKLDFQYCPICKAPLSRFKKV
jgi:rubrerythrin